MAASAGRTSTKTRDCVVVEPVFAPSSSASVLMRVSGTLSAKPKGAAQSGASKPELLRTKVKVHCNMSAKSPSFSAGTALYILHRGQGFIDFRPSGTEALARTLKSHLGALKECISFRPPCAANNWGGLLWKGTRKWDTTAGRF